MLIDASSKCHNLKFSKKIIIFHNISMSIWLISYITLPFGAAPTGNMFQKKMDKLFNDIPNVCGIIDDILIAGFDADNRDHDVRLEQVF